LQARIFHRIGADENGIARFHQLHDRAADFRIEIIAEIDRFALLAVENHAAAPSMRARRHPLQNFRQQLLDVDRGKNRLAEAEQIQIKLFLQRFGSGHDDNLNRLASQTQNKIFKVCWQNNFMAE